MNNNFNQGWRIQRLLWIFLGGILTIGGLILTVETSIIINLFIPILPIGLIILYVFLGSGKD